MNSNGLRLSEDRDLCEQLAELGVYVVLSFNTFDHKTASLFTEGMCGGQAQGH
jgi:uncharacterized radical SAM superfamily Fe-S cluster-containing enzyme